MPFFTGGPTTLSSVQQQGDDGLRSTFGQSFGSSLAEGAMETPVMRLAGAGLRAGLGSLGEPLQPDEANRRYGLPGLTFDKPITDALAGDLWNDRKTQLLRDQAVASGPRNIFARSANFAGGLIPQFLDPINAASVVVPGLGEEAVGSALVRGAMVADRIGATGAAEGLAGVSGGLADASAALDATRAGRIAKGAASGVVGQAALEPINYELDQSEHRDWSMNQALVNLAFGAVLGGAAGSLSRGASVAGRDLAEDAERGASEAEAAQPQPQPMPGQDRIDALTPDQRGSVLNEAVSAMTQDRPSVAHNLVTMNEAVNLRENISRWLGEHERAESEGAKVSDEQATYDRQYADQFESERSERQKLSERISALKEDHKSVSGELSKIEQEIDDIRSADPLASDTTPDRIAAIESELSSNGLTHKRRERLEQERTMILEGGGNDANAALDAARATAQVRGLEVRRRSLQKKLDRRSARIQEGMDRLSAPYAASPNDSLPFRIRAQRVDARKAVVRSGIERAISGFATRTGADLSGVDMRRVVDDIINAPDSAQEIERIISSLSERPRLDGAYSSGIIEAYQRALSDAAGSHDESVQSLTDAATRAVMDEPADVTAARQAVDRVTRDAPNFSGTDLDADVAEAERMAAEANNQLAALMGDEELTGVDRDISDVFDQAASDLEGDVKAYESVASCLWRNS